MILTIDIGNTTIALGLFKDQKQARYISWTTAAYSKRALAQFVRSDGKKISSAVVCSVVPRLNARIKKDIKTIIAGEVDIVNNTTVRIQHTYKTIQKLGTDRLIALWGARALYKAPLLVIDFGTAITFDYFNSDGIFEGGLIVPGVSTSLDALLNNAALLPKNVKLTKPRAFLGKDTVSCIQAGTVHGFVSLTDGLIARFKKKSRKKLTVIATGGAAPFIQPLCDHTMIVKPYFVLQSLYAFAHEALNNQK